MTAVFKMFIRCPNGLAKIHLNIEVVQSWRRGPVAHSLCSVQEE